MNPPPAGFPHARPVVWVALGYWIEPLFLGIARYAAEQGWILDASMAWRRGPIEPPKRRPDGIIVFTGDTPGLETAVRACGAPVVDLENYRDRYGAPRIVGDDRDVGATAARHLAANTPAKLVFVARPGADDETTRQRAKGFREEAERMGLRTVMTTSDAADPATLAAAGHCGVFCQGDGLALAFLDRCLEAGVAVPDDLAILGADDTGYICTLAPVPLSSLNMDFENKGRLAAELLDRLMRGEREVPKTVVAPIRGVTVRESTRAVRSGDGETDRFIRHLRDNSRRHVRVETLCGEFGIPLRTAQHRLRAKLGLSPSDLLVRFRLENAEALEKLGTMKLEAVAKAAGFGSAAALRRARKARP